MFAIARNLLKRTRQLGLDESPAHRRMREAAGVGLIPWRESLDIVREFWGSDVAADISQIPGAGRLNVIANFPYANDLNDFAAEFTGGISEVMRYTLYSYRVYAAAGQTQLIHFQQNVSSATNGLGDTNMQAAGALAGGESQLVMNIRVIPLPALADYSSATQANNVAFGQWTEVLNRNCWLEFKVGDKAYALGGPLSMFPAGIGPGSVVTLGASQTSVSWANNGHPSNMALWKQDPPTLILPTRSLVVYTNWTAALTVTTAAKLGVALDGYRIRKVQ